MRTTLICAIAALSLLGCGKKDKDKSEPAAKVQPDPATPTVPEKPAAGAEITVTSKSPEAAEHFKQGRDLVDHTRAPEGVEHFQKAIELDPDFALAHAYLGMATPGAEGLAHLDKAVTLAAKLPEPERLAVEARRALRAGEPDKAIELSQKVLAQAPGDWRSLTLIGGYYNESLQHEEAAKTFERAAALKPDLPTVHNGLAYAHAGMGHYDAAIAAATKQTELLPKQPNPQDTLGEILLMAGKFEEAEKAFQKALEIEPKFGIAWQGIAFSRAYRGDFAGVAEAAAKGKEAAMRPVDRASVGIDLAWLKLAEGKAAEAIALLDGLDKDAEIKKSPAHTWVAMDRAHILQASGKSADAQKWYATGVERSAALPPNAKEQVGVGRALGLLRIAAQTKKPAADADKLVAEVEAVAAKRPADKGIQSAAAWARGLSAWAKGDAKAAAAELARCDARMPMCRLDLAQAQRAAGDTAGADATEAGIKAAPQRSAEAVYVITTLGKKK